ncbi:LacI family DNA-binding transcriptional regulator [Clostridium sp. Marseille-P2415]|uniref:LacI family DNA-binding transcriptional regulator n=1 Tax=Clostridium sp. Marseille-P2415 TaxID=1805471 RepID=UPI001356369A|nr:LacI family DNA-binding transcriptional regulator [Clostridium sp. Marseille-P2415]
MVRIKDIAEYVGVSTTTVSNVIHGKEQRVSGETRKRIEEAVREMGYVPSMSALMLAQERSGIFGVILQNKEEDNKPALADPYYSALVGYLDQYIKQNHHYMLMITVPDEQEIIRQTIAWNLDGLIACNLNEDFLLSLHEHCNKPIVSVDTYINKKYNYTTVMTDDFSGGYQMGKYLTSMGHRKILLLADNDRGVDHYRWLGFKKALQESGIEVTKEQHVIISPVYQERMEQIEKMQAMLHQQTALFFASDFYALEACSVLRDMGFRIPEDISVTGFDDLLYARLSKPRLTTMRQSIEKKGEMAVKALLNLINHEQKQDWLLPVQLIERESVKRIE